MNEEEKDVNEEAKSEEEIVSKEAEEVAINEGAKKTAEANDQSELSAEEIATKVRQEDLESEVSKESNGKIDLYCLRCVLFSLFC